jgi:hypothetical protein
VGNGTVTLTSSAKEARMARSRLQELFMREYAATFQATQVRIARRLADSPPADAAAIVEDELRGLYHGLLVIFDGGSALADEGLVSVVDEEGVAFDRYLHEICFKYWPARHAEPGDAADGRA